MKSRKNTIKKINKMTNLVLLTFIFVIAFNIVSGSIIANGASTNTYETLTVETGDTLWSIAKEVKTADDDIRDVIFNIKELNAMNSDTIQPGQQLKVPVS